LPSAAFRLRAATIRATSRCSAFGGAGGLHAAEIARELHIPTLIVPRVPGHFSAFGMLMADLRHDYVRTYYKPLLSC